MGKAHIRVFHLLVKQPHCYCFPVNRNYSSVRGLFGFLYKCPFLCEWNPQIQLNFAKGVVH